MYIERDILHGMFTINTRIRTDPSTRDRQKDRQTFAIKWHDTYSINNVYSHFVHNFIDNCICLGSAAAENSSLGLCTGYCTNE